MFADVCKGGGGEIEVRRFIVPAGGDILHDGDGVNIEISCRSSFGDGSTVFEEEEEDRFLLHRSFAFSLKEPSS